MAHFKLRDGVYLVRGALRGALLDTHTENVYSLNASATAILAGEQEGEAFWLQLVETGIAERSESLVSLPMLPRLAEVNLRFIWFEINTSDCNECCIQCYADSMPATYRRNHRLQEVLPIPARPPISFAGWCSLIKEGYRLGCRRCQFIGGEPFLYRDGEYTVLDLAEHARKTGYKMVEIYTNATLLTPDKVDRIKQLGLHVAVSLYSYDRDTHESVTRLPGSFNKTMAALELLRAAGVKTRVEIVAMRQNEQTVPQTIQLIHEMGFGNRGADPLRPKGRGDSPLVMPSLETEVMYGIKTSPNFRANRQTVAHYSSAHSCLAGKVTINEWGDVMPCIFSRTNVMGNVADAGGLEPILLSDALQQVWRTTKDNVLVCRDCEYRYVCFDCRPLSEGAAAGRSDYLHAPYPRCSYNPYSGEWGAGLWRVGDDGPYYDRSYGPVIQQVLSNGTAYANTPTEH